MVGKMAHDAPCLLWNITIRGWLPRMEEVAMWKKIPLVAALAGVLVAASPVSLAIPGNGLGIHPLPPGLAGWSQSRELTGGEEGFLLHMREEEKLARDLYLDFSEYWKLPLFAKTARAEQRHMLTTGLMIELFGLEDPITDDGRGLFSDPAWSTLYAELSARGGLSIEEALGAAGWVEEADIVDLTEALEQSSDPALIRTFDHLLRGSVSHLRAVVKALAKRGVGYEAQLLDPDRLEGLLAPSADESEPPEPEGVGPPDWVSPGGGRPDKIIPGHAFGHGGRD